ncbi:hypothetical protein ASF50_16085 [Nocardioides sp. Leaf307]|nr:hypothetical protein ASF50_16085 [Nocardioides sp. Leaf307]
MMPVSVEIRRGTVRFVSRAAGRETKHSFAFGEHYDPERLSFGPIVCHDDHHLRGGTGFEAHRHTDLEIVTYVVSGALEHTHADPDGAGAAAEPVRVEAGSLALLSAGAGVSHSEVTVSGAGPVRFVQVWLRPDEPGATPSYAVHPDATSLEVPGVAGARLDVVRLGTGGTTTLPEAARVHAFVSRGALVRSSLAEPVQAGDAFLFVDEPAHEVTAAVPTELLVWSFRS